MDLEGEEAFEGGVLLIGVGEVSPQLAVEVGLEVVALADNHDGVPIFPLEESLALFGEGLLLLLGSLCPRGEPAPARLVKDPGGPVALGSLEVVVLALVAGYATVFGASFLQAAEHAAGVAGAILELELESEDEIAEFLFGAEESVALDLFPKAANSTILDLVVRGAAYFFPTGEISAVEEGGEARFSQRCGIVLRGETGREVGCCGVMVGEGGGHQEEREEECFH